MGNDGGSIPDRRDLVRNKPKAEQADKANQTKARWFYCALSKRKLQEPVVSCALGKLYNKDAIIEYLLDKSAYGDGEEICGHIRSLKDVKTLTLAPNPAPASSDASADSTDRPQFVCPLTLKEMNGVQPFIYISTCGCVFSQAGFKTVTAAGSPKEKDSTPPKGEEKGDSSLNLCPQCAKKYADDDIIQLNPSPEEEQALRFALERKRLLEPSKKKSKKRKNDASPEESEPPTKKPALPGPSLNPAIAGASRAVVNELAKEEAKRKANMSAAVKSLYGDGTKRKETFMTMGTFTRYA
ncbi:Replication termination factor 2 [Psilocybe cubensis]|uniref:Replication termination factor 2 n=2 Tax=Psilocybe cubensis TaxID=181762 RepID=A0ACB8HH59_PSICU|nr:Replication termination factor 2 [Psilocybe cubensis]KAH9487360.1 Replication termination factor 2 [Psilocybe cubensis]